MRRITTWLLSTISALVLLFSYHTSTSAKATTSIQAEESATDTTTSGTDSGGSSSGTGSGGSSDASGTDSGGSSSGTGSGTGSGGSASGSSSGSSSSGAGGTSSSKTYTGEAVSTRFGPVQVQITVTNGKVTKSIVTQVPWSNGRDQEINSYAVPILNKEAVAAQGSSIDMVSGATFTSDAYIQSLQSAIDQASL